MTPPDLTPEQVIAEALGDWAHRILGVVAGTSAYDEGADTVLAALREHGPVGWQDVRERLTSDDPIGFGPAQAGERVLRDFGWEGVGASVAANAAIRAAIDYAEEGR